MSKYPEYQKKEYTDPMDDPVLREKKMIELLERIANAVEKSP